MSVTVADNPQEARFEAVVDGQLAGFAQYTLRGDQITIFHTEIGDRYEGQGVGSQLARFALASVRERGLELIPLCPFIAGYVRKHPDDYLDLVVASKREKVMANG